ncbi:hypothetical protein Hte_000901 [Hypoxylon texense]
MDDSVHPNAPYGAPSFPSPSYNDSGLHAGNHTFDDSTFSLNTSLDTISPSSLDLYHTSHDDSCVDKCVGPYNMQGVQRGMTAPSFNARMRFPSFNPYQLPGSNAFQVPYQTFNMSYQNAIVGMGSRYGQIHSAQPSDLIPHSQLLYGNHFNAADLGNSQYPASDDNASVNCSNVSCQSDCCSTQPCQEEACSQNGTPCDDLGCLNEINEASGAFHMWDMNPNISQEWVPSTQQRTISPLHDQPCNHTNTEHDVAITLRDLRAPGATTVQQPQQQLALSYDHHLIGASNHQTRPGAQLPLRQRPYPNVSVTPDLGSSPPPLLEAVKAPEVTSQFVCRWKTTSGEPGVPPQICGQIYHNSDALHKHLDEEHSSSLTSKTGYACAWDGCSRETGKGFPSRNKLTRHIATHSGYKPFECELCGECFSAQQALDQHVRTHTGEKPYACDAEGCDKSFKQKSALTMHKRTHTGEKPLQCQVCGKCFGESSNLSKHRKIHEADPKYKCEEPGCTSRFIRFDQLRRHQARHERGKKKKQARQNAAASPTPTPTPVTSPEEPLQQEPLHFDGNNMPLEQAESV